MINIEEKTFEEIKKLCYHQGAIDALGDVTDMINRIWNDKQEGIPFENIWKTLQDLDRKYMIGNIPFKGRSDKIKQITRGNK